MRMMMMMKMMMMMMVMMVMRKRMVMMMMMVMMMVVVMMMIMLLLTMEVLAMKLQYQLCNPLFRETYGQTDDICGTWVCTRQAMPVEGRAEELPSELVKEDEDGHTGESPEGMNCNDSKR